MAKVNKVRRIVAFSGAAALTAVVVNFVISIILDQSKKWKKRDLPGCCVRVNLSASEIQKLTDSIIYKSNEIYDLVASIPLEEAIYANVIAPLVDLEEYQYPLIQCCLFHKMVATSDDVRKASADAERRLDSHFQMCRKREDVYCVIKAFVRRGEWLGPEAKRYVQYLVKDYERNGANLSSSKRKEMESLKFQMEKLSLEYIQNLAKNDNFLSFSEKDLTGMPPQFIKSLDKTESGDLKVFLKSYQVLPILEYCKVGATRKFVATSYGQKCGQENLIILEKLVQLRHKFATLLGYSNYADFVAEPRMAKTSTKVFEFLEEVSNKLSHLAARELSFLRKLKVEEEGDTSFGMEDIPYYIRRAKELLFNLDLSEVREYFPLNLVLSGIFKIFQDLFGLSFVEVKDVEVWHETVLLYSIRDSSSNELLGYVYVDLLSRDGKFGHTCVLSLQNGCSSTKVARKIPVTLLIFNCTKQIDDAPVMMRFTDVIGLFHEFCHVVHHICNRASFSRFSGLGLEADFVEIPAQLLENWCYESISIEMMSGHYEDITKSVTMEMCKLLKKKRDLFSGLKLKQEIFLCLIDQIIHSSDSIDILELWNHLHPKVMVGLPLLDGTKPGSYLPRAAIGYDATCYSQLWSEVYAADIFASKFQDDLLNQHSGLQFRNKILAPGGSRDPYDILSEYLGREPSTRGFIDIKTSNSLPSER
ncbi:thimet oligopeptidase [Apostasia shenzhenica]|uniref:Thimet oligopeptidase n=1 Tax=Apostasia shenzhenica TaxID=1088818 RepID=A0A2I0A302_9ASPA|nr:thimet oligopeptidase [Apostasia shenzhenica]